MLAVICDDLAPDRELLLGSCARYGKTGYFSINAILYRLLLLSR